MTELKIISGGQTGVDRAALDAALELDIPQGGFCPKGRRAEDGVIPDKYNLIETDTELYNERTEKNVETSDGTLILYLDEISGGTLTTLEYCTSQDKPCFTIDLLHLHKFEIHKLTQWIQENRIEILNIAGPREDGSGVYKSVKEFLLKILCEIDKQVGKSIV